MPSRNGPCPCGSTIKYKKCCLAKDEAAQRALAAPPQPASRIHRRGRPLPFSGGRDLPGDVVDPAVELHAAEDGGEGPVAQLMRFAQPLLDGCDDAADRGKALRLGVMFWALALVNDGLQEELIAQTLRKISDERKAAEFRALAKDMVKRHQAMFPAMHQ